MWRGRLLLGPFDMGPDRVLRVIDPAVWAGLFDHGAEIALPCGVARDLGPLAQRLFINPRMALVLHLGDAVERAAHLVEPRGAAFDNHLEGSEVVLVFQ